jgi:hypothetical protein
MHQSTWPALHMQDKYGVLSGTLSGEDLIRSRKFYYSLFMHRAYFQKSFSWFPGHEVPIIKIAIVMEEIFLTLEILSFTYRGFIPPG